VSYVLDHPTHFNFTQKVQARVKAVQRRHPYQTFINTYVDHPPGYNRIYERRSLDVWGGGGHNQATYSGYRGKPLPKALGDRIWGELFYAEYGPAIHWIIWNGKMWVAGSGFQNAPYGPPDSDPGHYNHIHCTYKPSS
jgi:hypothetical protein